MIRVNINIELVSFVQMKREPQHLTGYSVNLIYQLTN